MLQSSRACASPSSASDCSSDSDDAEATMTTPPRPAAAQQQEQQHARVRSAAYATELAQLREAVALLSRAGGASGVLEGKYLQQVRRVRELTVQLETQKTRVHTLEQQLAHAQPTQRGGGGGAMQRQRRPSHALPHDGSSHASGEVDAAAEPQPSSSSSVQQQQVRALRERLDRVYQQLHERERHVDELRRENAQLCGVLTHELGVGKDEVLRAAATMTTSSNGSRNNNVDTKDNNNSSSSGSSCSGGGWRGRVAQIVLLRGKVKDLERALANARAVAAAAATTTTTNDGGDTRKHDTNDDDGMTRLHTATRTRTSASAASAAVTSTCASTCHARVADEATTTSSAADGGSTRDVDDVARERVAQMASQRLGSVRALEAALAQRDRDVRAARDRATAQLARTHVLQRECAQLRQHIHVLLDKSASDDALIAAYRDEVRALRATLYKTKAQQQQQQHHNNNDNNNNNNTERSGSNHGDADGCANETTRSSAGDGGNDAATSAATMQRLRAEVQQLRQQLSLTQQQQQQSNASCRDDKVNDGDAALRAWLLAALAASADVRACDAATTTARPRRNNDDDDDEAVASASSSLFALGVAAVLRAAHAHVVAAERRLHACESASTTRLYERYTRLLDSVQARLLGAHDSSNNDNNSNHDGSDGAWLQKLLHALPPLEPFVLHENASLKQRVRSLTAVAEREAVAQQVLCDELLREHALTCA